MSQENVTKDDDLLTAAELAEWLDVPTGSIHALAARDAIPYVKPKKWWKAAEYRFWRSEIEEWLRSDPSWDAIPVDPGKDAHADS